VFLLLLAVVPVDLHLPRPIVLKELGVGTGGAVYGDAAAPGQETDYLVAGDWVFGFDLADTKQILRLVRPI
jgi:hypothetical protein